MAGVRVLIGGVGYRWFGDGSFGLVASDELARLDWPEGVDVEDLGYGLCTSPSTWPTPNLSISASSCSE